MNHEQAPNGSYGRLPLREQYPELDHNPSYAWSGNWRYIPQHSNANGTLGSSSPANSNALASLSSPGSGQPAHLRPAISPVPANYLNSWQSRPQEPLIQRQSSRTDSWLLESISQATASPALQPLQQPNTQHGVPTSSATQSNHGHVLDFEPWQQSLVEPSVQNSLGRASLSRTSHLPGLTSQLIQRPPLPEPVDTSYPNSDFTPLVEPGLGSGDEEDYDFLDQFDQEDDEELSDADTEYMNVRADVSKFVDSVRKFRSEHRGEDGSEDGSQDGLICAGRTKPKIWRRENPRNRGARKAAEPTGDIKYRLSTAVQAFIEEDYHEAFRIAEEIIRINAETHEAWTLMASIHREVGQVDHALRCMIFACHLRPKDVQGWLIAGKFALEETGDDRRKYLASAKLCYSCAIRANTKDDFEGRLGKAAVLREDGNTTSAISVYRGMLKKHPHNSTILRNLAETYIDRDDAESAKLIYEESIAFFRGGGTAVGKHFGWTDVSVYVELHGYQGEYAEGIKALKSLSRWLLGRQSETYWDSITEDDREWDLNDSRRIEVDGFVARRFSLESYGKRLPLELRVKLGLFRLKLDSFDQAMSHFEWLDPERKTRDDRVLEHPDLVRDIADGLQDAGHFKEALIFYKSIRVNTEYEDSSIFFRMAQCFLKTNDSTEAEEHLKLAIQFDDSRIDARILLAKLLEDRDEGESAFMYMNEVISMQRDQGATNWNVKKQVEPALVDFGSAPAIPETVSKPKRKLDPATRESDDLKASRLKGQFLTMRLEHKGMQDGLQEPSLAWMEAASELVDDFRGCRTFYPNDRYLGFQGYSGSTSQQRTGATPLEVDVEAMASRLSENIENLGSVAPDIPENYRGIPFSAWLDIFLEYALCLAKYGRNLEAYEICQAAKDAVVWFHNRGDMFLIHVGWAACAVLANDEETCVEVCRFFMKDYQFTTDSYRMFAALSRLCQSPASWYSSGPTQKYMLRQIKAMDYNLVDPMSNLQCFVEKASYTSIDDKGRLVKNVDFDVSLLMLYGHILYSGTSYAYALNYFLRAHSLDPHNAMINLSIGLGYVHYGLKRQAENRQFHILQGLGFLVKYYQSRRDSPVVEERQEAHYNMARTYHMLGVTHLALPYYMKVLHEVQGSEPSREDLVVDAAFNLQTLYAMVGNLEMAQSVTETWLVL